MKELFADLQLLSPIWFAEPHGRANVMRQTNDNPSQLPFAYLATRVTSDL